MNPVYKIDIVNIIKPPLALSSLKRGQLKTFFISDVNGFDRAGKKELVAKLVKFVINLIFGKFEIIRLMQKLVQLIKMTLDYFFE